MVHLILSVDEIIMNFWFGTLVSFEAQGITMDDDFSDGFDLAEFDQAIAAVEDEIENNMARLQVEEEIEIDGEGIITEFNPHHIITDSGLRIPIDRFSINIRSKVRGAFIDKGPTQPIGYKFPKSSTNRSFQKNWFKEHCWLEYSVEKDRAYCFYCYLFKHDRMDDNFRYDVFSSLEFNNWKNAYLSLRKHNGKLHNPV